MGNLHYRSNFNPGKINKIYYHSSKEHLKIGSTTMVGFRVRNTFVCKFANFAMPYFPHFTTFRNQTWQFY